MGMKKLSQVVDTELKNRYGNYTVEMGEFFSDNGDNGALILEIVDDDSGHDVFYIDTMAELDEVFENWKDGGGCGKLLVSLDNFFSSAIELVEVCLDPAYEYIENGNKLLAERN